MSWIDILVLVITLLVTFGLIAYVIISKIKRKGACDCGCSHLTGKSLVKKYHKENGCCCQKDAEK